MSSLPPNPCTASHVESAVSQPPLATKCPQRSELGRPLPLTLYVSPTPCSPCMLQSVHCCVVAGRQPSLQEPGSSGEDDPPDGCLDYTRFGTSIRTVYFDNHPGDTLTQDDAQLCLDTALHDYLRCSRSPGKIRLKRTTTAAGAELAGGVGRPPISHVKSPPSRRKPPVWSEWRNLCTYALILPRTCIVSGHELVGATASLQSRLNLSTAHDQGGGCGVAPTFHPTHPCSPPPPTHHTVHAAPPSIRSCCVCMYVCMYVCVSASSW